MDDLNFNVDDIINDVNAKIKSAEKNEADEESVEAEPIADTENSSESCEQADNTDEKPQETPEATDDKPEPILAFHEDKSEEDKSEEDEDKEPEKPEKQEKKSKSSKKKKKKRKKSKVNNSVFGGIILVIVILTVSLVLAVGGISIGMEYYGIGKTDEDIRFNIPAGFSNFKASINSFLFFITPSFTSISAISLFVEPAGILNLISSSVFPIP